VPGLASYGAPPPVRLEGEYSRWTFMWKRYYHDDTYPAPCPNRFYVLEALDRIILFDAWNYAMQILRLSDGTLLEEYGILHDDYHSRITPSILIKYFAVVMREAGKPVLKIYKDGSLIQSIDLTAVCGWTNTTRYYGTIFSPDGKYLFVSNTEYGVYEYALFKGS
jgi:hypothetical protein